MSKKTQNQSNSQTIPGFEFVKKVAGIEEHKLKSNGLRVLYMNRPDTGVITTNILYFVGARDESRGETGLAHMLEHMLFKPTSFDKKRGHKSGAAMTFERETGCSLNATTWKDRTHYFFSYPTEYFDTALQIEAERMNGVLLTKEELEPEQNNVLSEFDMNNGDPHFAIEVQLASIAFHSHPYGHETIGYREDIENYTAEKLDKFYKTYYRPDNAMIMILGDVDKKEALKKVKEQFADIKSPNTLIPRFDINESKQEGIRRFNIERPSTTNIVALGFKHPGFPSTDWFVSFIMMSILTSGPESLLQKILIDKGMASSVDGNVAPLSEESITSINITLAQDQTHEGIEKLTLEAIRSLDLKTITPLIKKMKQQIITDELFSREHSVNIAFELTEYTSAGSWETYADTTKILESITPKMVMDRIKESFVEQDMTIGYFKGIQ